MKNVVIIGGGTGTFTLLSGLREFPANNSVIVSTADDGGSTGRLRGELGILPPGDIRQCLLGLSYTDETLRNLFAYRFEKGSLRGHNAGNVIIAALEKITGSIEQAIIAVAKLLNVRGQVVPVTLFPTMLSAVYANGKKIVGEHNIDEVHPSLALPLGNPLKIASRFSGNPDLKGREIKKEKLLPLEGRANKKNNSSPLVGEVRWGVSLRIKNVTLKPSSPANPRALRLIAEADAIIFGPGDLYTSTIPNLLVKGVAEAIKKSTAKKMLITNLMTKHGQTNHFQASDFVPALEKYLGRRQIDTVIVNTKKPSSVWIKRHQKEHSEFVTPDISALKKMKIKVVAEDLLSSNPFQKDASDQLHRSYLRHDSKKLARLIWELI